MTTAPTVSPEAFLADPVHAVGEEPAPDEHVLTPLERLADVEYRLARVEQRAFALEDLAAGGQATSSDAEALSWMPQEISDLQGVVLAKTVELQDLEDKHLTLLAVVDEIGRIVKKSTSKVSLEVKAAIDEWANPVASQGAHTRTSTEAGPDFCKECSDKAGDWVPWPCSETPSPAPDASPSEPQPEPIPATSTEARAGEGSPWRVNGVPTHDAPVEEWRTYARAVHAVPEGTVLDQMNRSQIRTMLGIEQPVGA